MISGDFCARYCQEKRPRGTDHSLNFSHLICTYLTTFSIYFNVARSNILENVYIRQYFGLCNNELHQKVTGYVKATEVGSHLDCKGVPFFSPNQQMTRDGCEMHHLTGSTSVLRFDFRLVIQLPLARRAFYL